MEDAHDGLGSRESRLKQCVGIAFKVLPQSLLTAP